MLIEKLCTQKDKEIIGKCQKIAHEKDIYVILSEGLTACIKYFGKLAVKLALKT